MSQSTLSSSNAPSGVPPPLHAFVSSNKYNPSMAIIIVVLLSALIVVAIFSMYVRRCTQGGRDETSNRVAPARNGNQSVHFYERPGEGLDRALVDALPVVSFSVVKTLKSGKEDLECAVCLEKFKEDEALWLLPQCSHVFHTECIDLWFHSHSTCPLCRMSLKPTFDGIGAGVPEIGEVSRRILDAQEEIFGSARHVLDVDSPVFENEVPKGSSSRVEQIIGRDDERNSARMTLFRNLDSFRQAARGVEIRERLATLSARYPASATDVHKECPQRSSSLSCINLSLERIGSAGAAEIGEFINSEDFKYGSQRPGVAGPSLNDSLGRLGSLNDCGL